MHRASSSSHRAAPALLLAGILFCAAAAPAHATRDCGAGTLVCAVSGNLAAGVVQFRAGNDGDRHWAQANLRIANVGRTPLALGYVDRSGQLLDENGNSYRVPHGGARGIGIIHSQRVDTSFVLQPGESADARFEFEWTRGPQARTGLQFQMSLAVREVSELPGGQVKLGREHLLRWAGLTDTPSNSAGAPGSSARAAVPAPAAPPLSESPVTAAALSDPCGGRSSCQSTAAFIAEVARVSQPVKTTYAGELMVNVGFRVTNRSAAPLLLAFVADSGQMIDNRGERYTVKYVHRERVAGIGMRRSSSIDPQFVLQPGESRPFTLGYSRSGAPNGATGYSVDLVLAQLELLPGNQVRVVRDHALSFPQTSAGAVSAGAAPAVDRAPAAAPADLNEAVQALRDLFKKR